VKKKGKRKLGEPGKRFFVSFLGGGRNEPPALFFLERQEKGRRR